MAKYFWKNLQPSSTRDIPHDADPNIHWKRRKVGETYRYLIMYQYR